jgi:septum formation protein
MKLILASKSPRRRRLMRELGLNFKVMHSNVDESVIQEDNPIDLVKKLSMLKAATVSKGMREHAIIIGADSEVVIDGQALGKPNTKKAAREMLQRLSGKEHRVYTGICIINTQTGNVFSDISKTKVRFRGLNNKEIERIAADKDVTDWAGAYKIQDHHWLFHSIDGSYTNVVGLPLEKLIPLLRENGVDI